MSKICDIMICAAVGFGNVPRSPPVNPVALNALVPTASPFILIAGAVALSLSGDPLAPPPKHP